MRPSHALLRRVLYRPVRSKRSDVVLLWSSFALLFPPTPLPSLAKLNALSTRQLLAPFSRMHHEETVSLIRTILRENER